jgi:hypothetical protein
VLFVDNDHITRCLRRYDLNDGTYGGRMLIIFISRDIGCQTDTLC